VGYQDTAKEARAEKKPAAGPRRRNFWTTARLAEMLNCTRLACFLGRFQSGWDARCGRSGTGSTAAAASRTSGTPTCGSAVLLRRRRHADRLAQFRQLGGDPRQVRPALAQCRLGPGLQQAGVLVLGPLANEMRLPVHGPLLPNPGGERPGPAASGNDPALAVQPFVKQALVSHFSEFGSAQIGIRLAKGRPSAGIRRVLSNPLTLSYSANSEGANSELIGIP